MIETVIDVETTGFPCNKPLDHEDQPYIVEVGILQRGNESDVFAQHSFLVQCPIEVPQGALNIHGITQDHTRDFGFPSLWCMDLIHAVLSQSDVVIAHNLSFDLKCLDIMAARRGDTLKPSSHPFKQFCTMKTWAECFGGKWPKLGDACDKAGFDTSSLRTHRALDDCHRALAVYDHLQAHIGL